MKQPYTTPYLFKNHYMFQQVREINPTRRSVSGNYPFRGQVSVSYESTLERDFIVKKEFDITVIQVIPQPVSIPFSINGRTYQYTPDFLVLFDTTSKKKGLLVEVKPENEWRKNWRSWLPKWKAAYRWCHDHDFIFHIFDENRIRDTYLENIKLLNRFKTHINPPEEQIILQKLEHIPHPVMIESVLQQFSANKRNDCHRLILGLLARHLLITDMRQPITKSSFISLLGFQND